MIDDPLVKTEKEDQENDPKPEDLPFDFVMYPFQWKTDACSKETDEGRSDVSFGSVCLEIVFQALFCAYRIEKSLHACACTEVCKDLETRPT